MYDNNDKKLRMHISKKEDEEVGANSWQLHVLLLYLYMPIHLFIHHQVPLVSLLGI
jgi:hypothetical protein